MRLMPSSCPYVRLFVRPYASIGAPHIGRNLILATFKKTCPESPNFFKKIGQNYRTHDTLFCCRPHSLAIEALLCNNKYFYIVESDGQLNNKHRIHYCFSTATMVTRTHHNVVIHMLLSMLWTLAQLAEALRYKPEGRWFDSRCCHWNFSLT